MSICNESKNGFNLANVVCEIREVRLSNKPKQMLEVSPKGTVPVLILEDRVIEESIEIVNWVLSSNNIFDGNLSNEQMSLTEELIKSLMINLNIIWIDISILQDIKM